MNIVQFHSDLTKLIEVLPPKITKNIPEKSKLFDVIELVLDYGRLPEIRHGNHEIEYLGDDLIEKEKQRLKDTWIGPNNVIANKPNKILSSD